MFVVAQVALIGVMHIDTIPNRNSRPSYLLRESVRDGKKVSKRTLANLSSLPIEQIEMIRRVLKGERLGPVEDGLECVRSAHHGHVEAVTAAMHRKRRGSGRITSGIHSAGISFRLTGGASGGDAAASLGFARTRRRLCDVPGQQRLDLGDRGHGRQLGKDMLEVGVGLEA